MQWTRNDERSLQCALRQPRNQQMLRVLVQRYGYAPEDVLQEIRVSCLQRFSQKPQYARSTIIDRTATFKLMHLCRYEGKRHVVFG